MTALSFQIENGQVQNRETLWGNVKETFQRLPDGKYTWPKPVKARHQRSVQQNRYYWGVVCKLVADHTGYSPDEVHQIFTNMFLSYNKKGHKFTESTTRLNTQEFEWYMEECRRWAAMELQVYIPNPNCPENFFYDLPGEAKVIKTQRPYDPGTKKYRQKVVVLLGDRRKLVKVRRYKGADGTNRTTVEVEI